ncbi:amidase [Pseudonocardia kunmingensis]|uniref:Aspartyl-tRNA(Asn)/glutamyl-tRNA(Gln) amidotransferase subunit A n=1 Tax=Pseudonocardia kunmingensis TaxID=630975 RepID=A0A543DB03_9PSEU|nr:amidase [Pseudonocardia kunmingensis]TQM06519.1 aspartyl-tRNA(Asn)/glutamyl-tRNA(Gln) amidotransferase subunit A [Pseudonocardia kunmingensis]
MLPPLRELGMALRSRELSATDHVRDVLGRLGADTTGAVITLDAERALAAAAALDEELARGSWRGPLHGVAVGVKDLIDVAGLPTRAGSDVLADAPPAAADAPVVARLREAGAVVVAKLHTHEFAYGPTGDVAATGPARNPHDPTRITGGSSSGSAAAVASGHVPLALGTDTGASVRTPAALCGVVGLKPAYGALSAQGCFPLSETLDHVGVLAPDVHAASVAWDVLSRPDGTGGGIQAPGVDGVRVGVLVDEYWRALDPALTAAVDTAAARLEKGGAQVQDVRTPMIDELAATYPVIVGAEAYATHAHWLRERPQDYQEITRERLLPFADLHARAYVDALRTRRRLTAALRAAVDGVDVLLLPTTRLRATPIGAEEVEVAGSRVPVRPQLLALTLPFNLTGWPAVSVPGEVTDGGLPAGVQVVGVRLEERGVLRVAAALEQA